MTTDNISELRTLSVEETADIEGGWGISAMILMQYHIEVRGYTSQQAHEYASSLTPEQGA